MKILITTECYYPAINGVVTSIINLQRELKKLGHEVKILTLSANTSSYQKDGVTYISSVGVGKIYPGARLSLLPWNSYLEELVYWNPDIIHSQCEFSTYHFACRLAKRLHIPIVHTYHTVYEDYTHYFSPYPKWGKAMVSIFTKIVLSRTACVIVPTDKVKKILVEYGVNKEIKVIPSGIDMKRFKNLKKNQNLRKRYEIPIDHKVLISVGRLAKEKNLEELIQFTSRLNNSRFTLLIIGDGPHRKNLEHYAKTFDNSTNIIFTGMIQPEEIDYYYQIGDIFVSASNSETQGLTYVEALANGIPALCRKDPCLENVIEDGVNGWQYTTFQEFRKGVDLILRKKRYQKLCRNAKVRAERDFSATVFAKDVEQIYQCAISSYQKKGSYANTLLIHNIFK